VKHLVLVCAVGMSSSMLVNRMIRIAEKKELEVMIHASGMGDLSSFTGEADALLISPQIHYMEEKIKAKYPNIPVMSLSAKDYAEMDGEKVLMQGLALIKD